MNSLRLKYFLAVSETQSIRKASEILNLSPATLCRAVKQLEDELGCRLLVPRGRGVAVTDFGLELAQKSRPLLRALDDLAKNSRGQSLVPPRLSIRIGSFEIFTTYLLRHLFSVLPDYASATLEEKPPGQIEQSLLSREIDYGITYLPVPYQGIDHYGVGSVSMGVFALKGMFDQWPMETIPFVAPIGLMGDTVNPTDTLDGWPHQAIRRHIPYGVTLLESGLELCRMGKAAAYLPCFIVRLHNQITLPAYHLAPVSFLTPFVQESRPIHLMRRQNDPMTAFWASLVMGLRAVCDEDSL